MTSVQRRQQNNMLTDPVVMALQHATVGMPVTLPSAGKSAKPSKIMQHSLLNPHAWSRLSFVD
jgi:hypothetical protein